LQPLPDPDESPPPRPSHNAPASPPPVVVYEPPPPAVVERPEAPPPYDYSPYAHEQVSRSREWGLNLHVEGASIGRGTAGDAAMGGAGLGLRYKPVRSFGIETDIDFVGGHDYQGDSRNETAFTFNGLIFLNPRSRAQFYLLAGFGWSAAHLQNDAQTTSASYSYFGGQGGIGLEARLSRSLAFNVDVRGFIRSRTDSLAQTQPEFTDQYGRTTNTSGGGLFTGGMTIYF
jgi:hypothetical protein